MCHGSFAAFTSTRASVSIGTTTTNQVPLSGFHYVAGTQYIIFFSALSHSARTGFEISSLNAANGNAGTLAVTNAANTTFGTLGGIGYIGHHNADTTKNWSFHWTAPAATAGNITFYTAVNITNNNGNDAGDSIFHNTFIISPVPITVSAGNDTTVCAGSSAQLVAVPANTSGAVTYAWSPTSGLTCSNCANPTATPLSTTTYTVTITNSGQTATDAVTVNVLSTSAPIINVTS
ncbi:MAG: hypothetical protein JWO06_2349, partial [Bacteroidota bacterium]|nr:hypothetical protein [Bacteroidota bacterium]